MAYPLRFHVLLLPNIGWDDLKSRAVRLEALGFDVVALADHFVDWTNPPAPWFECWTALAAIAEATETIRLSSIVSQIPLRNPAMFARQALTLDHISHGRIEVGLGTGLTIDPSYVMTGLPNWSAGERVARFAEYTEIVHRLLSREETTFNGRFYQIAGAMMNPRPVQRPRPPLLIAALAPRMLELTARWAEIWNSLSFQPDFGAQLAETAARAAAIDAACVRIGRDPATLRRSYTMFDPQARPRGGAMAYYDSPDAFAEYVSRVVALGISDVGLYYPLAASQLATFERIAMDTIPALRAAYPAIG